MTASRRLLNSPGVRTFCFAAVVVLVLATTLQMTNGSTGARAGAKPHETAATTEATSLPAGVPKSFIDQAQESIARQEYEASRTAFGLQAPNRAHNLRTYFEPWGVRVEDRTEAGRPELFRMKTARIGREGRMATIASGVVRATGVRVENRREGGVVEWYENGEGGLEHGYVLDRRPAGDGVLHIDVAFESATVGVVGDRAVIRTGTGRQFEYGKLSVEDATGRSVAAWFGSGDGGTVRLSIDDDGAVYPLVVDPLLTNSTDTMIESDQNVGELGSSVAMADVNGDGFSDVIVGAVLYDAGQADEGAAFIFHGDPSGIPNANPTGANTTIESNQVGANLGLSVASAGDVNGDGFDDIIVGAYFYSNGQTNEGAAFVYHGGPSGIPSGNPTTANATLEGNQGTANFGLSVAGAGDVNGDGYADVIVGAPSYDGSLTNSGGAFIFHGGPAGITSGGPATANGQLDSNQTGSNFGESVASAGDVNGDGFADVIVGGSLYDQGQSNEGAAFVFLGSGGGIPTGNPGTANAILESNLAAAAMGLSVAGAGDVNGDGFSDVIVGANHYNAGQADEGAAFVFHGGPGGILSNGNPSTANATLQSDQGNAQLGWSVASAGDVNGDGFADVIVGSRLFDATQADEGAAFVYYGGAAGILNGNPMTADATLKLGQNNGQVGWSVAGGGDVNGDGYSDVIVGALFFDNGQTDEGAAFVSLGGAEGVRNANAATAHATLEADQITGHLGISVAGAGDVNGDGFSDIIVGAADYDSGMTDEGAAFVFHGGPTGVPNANPSTANTTLVSGQMSAHFGVAVAGAGDVNGDGFADVIVGADLYDNGQPDEGAAFVFHGGPSGVANGTAGTAAATLQSDQPGANMGNAVAGAGDINGDGYADVIVGALLFDSGQSDEGAAFVFHGGPSGIANGTPGTANTMLQSDQPSAIMGNSVAGAGDVNGDGYADVIVGTRAYDSSQVDEGAAFVFHGGPSGIANGGPGTANATLQSDQGGANLGWSVAGAGDVNGDGFADVIVAAPLYDSGELDEGVAFVFHGGSSGIPSSNPTGASTTLESNQVSSLCRAVAGVGDVNGDGFADVGVGWEFYDLGQVDEGAVCIFYGRPSGVMSGNPSTAGATLQSDQADSSFGQSLAGVGDVNGDGYADVLVGSYRYDNGQADEGAAFLFYGNGDSTGRPVRAQQLRGGGSPINVEPWGSSMAGDFQVQLKATHPAGRGRVSLEIEVAPSGETWGGPNSIMVISPWIDTFTAPGGVTLTQFVPGLPPAFTLFHWRARVRYAPVMFQAVPVAPRHGPWRRGRGQAVEADIRVNPAACILTCPADIMTTNDAGQCSAVVTFAPTTMGVCGAVTCVPPSGSAFPVGVTAVMCSETFGSMCSFMVTVTDTEPPTVMCPADIMTGTDPGQCSAMVTYATSTAMDNCPGATVNCLPPSGSVFATGATMVNCTAMDVGLNTAMCSFMVTVNDTEAPTVTCPTDITRGNDVGQCSAVVNYATPPAMDNCPGATVNCTPASGSTFALGATMVTCTATDAALNTGMCSFMVTVNDTEPPALVCPSNVIATTDPGQCTSVVSYVTPSATDNCPGATVNCSPLSGTLFPQGVTTVTCTAMDGASNTTPCMFTVTVNDNQPPSVTCPGDIAVNAGAGQCSAIVTYVTPSATDNCPGATVNCVPASGLAFPMGVTTVTCTAMDSVAMVTCMFTVSVADNQAPTLVCPANILQGLAPGETSAIVNYATPTVIDNCPGSGTAVCSPASGSTFAVGTTTVTCSATDASANMTTCAFTVTLDESVAPPGTADLTLVATSAPSISAPGAVVTYTITATNNGPAAAPNLTITDELPPEVTYSSHTASPGASVTAPPVDTNGTVTAVWPGDTAAGETRTLTITVTVSVLTPDGALIVNSPTVSSGLPDTDPSSNGSTANVDVDVNEAAVRADLSITITGGGTEVNTGDVVTYQIEVFNAGPDDAQDVQVFTTVPNGTRFSSITLSQGTATTPQPGATGLIVCNLGTIANGGSATILIDVVVRSDGGEFITNSATVQSSTVDPVANNNSRPDQVFVNEGTMIVLSWDPPDQTDDDRTLPPLHLQTTNVVGRGETLAVALRQAQSVARRNTLIGFNIYRSNKANVATTPANLYSSTPPTITSANVTAAPGGSFFTVTAVYPNGESNGANEATGGLPEPTITGVRVKGGKLLIDGSNFGNAPVVFVDGIPFTKAVKAKPAKSRLVQKGVLLTGQSVADYVNSRNGVVLVSVYNSAIGIGTYLYTR